MVEGPVKDLDDRKVAEREALEADSWRILEVCRHASAP